MKKIIGLDLGTNSIGAALVNLPENLDDYGKYGKIEWAGSRIIPVDGEYLQKFESGGPAETKAAARRMKRGSRRLKHRYKLRRTRLTQIFKILGWLDDSFPENFKKQIQFNQNYKFNINDYLPFEETTIEEAKNLLGIKNKEGNLIIPEDWVVYYLRKKALSTKISLAELARIIYMLNQRRGFKSSRKDLKEEGVKEKKWVEIVKIKSVELESSEPDKNKKFTFIITADSENIKPWKEKRYKKPEWEGKEFTLLVTEKSKTKSDGTITVTQNKPEIPKVDDWALSMVALDNQIDNQMPGSFFWDKLVEDKNYRIRQIAVRREKYKKELQMIWNKQLELRIAERKEQEILNEDKLERIITHLYRKNISKQKQLRDKGLLHIISDDIIYYQRELKSQKHSISECRYEKLKAIDGEYYGLKCAPKSSPEFQEYRIWQDLHNIRILERETVEDGVTKIDIDVTDNFIDENIKEKLFELFDSSKSVTQDDIFNLINSLHATELLNSERFRINLFANRGELSGHQIKTLFKKLFKKFKLETKGEELINDSEKLRRLWHIYYSISSSDIEKSAKGIRTALKKLIPENDDIIEAFTKLPEEKKEYASLSSKAIKKLLPLMRCGKYWNWHNINVEVQGKIENIIKNGWESSLDKRATLEIRKRHLTSKENFSALPTWLACYVVYARHSEKEYEKKYTESEISHLDVMKLIPNNSLRNPIVEQVVRETLFLVKDICKKFGQPDEIHIELGRELKKNREEKERISKNNSKNFEEKQRIKKLLYELLNGEFEHYDENEAVITHAFTTKPNPENPSDVEKFRIYKSCAMITSDEEKNNWDALFKDGNKQRIPTVNEIKKYTLWLSQKCISPYTGTIIPLSKLFDRTKYEIEHIIPQSKLKYDAFENLVISEAEINPEPYKGNMLARNFIKHFSGQKLQIGDRKFKILTNDEYEAHCKKTFRGKKLKNLLATEIPDDFVERQINDTRYITRKVTELLHPFTKKETGIVFTIGSITSELKNEWGLNSIWKGILKPRFERLEKIEQKKMIFEDEEDKNKFHFHIPQNPELELKRIDHRHHALDAIIVAATTREHIRYLNSLNAVDTIEELMNVKRALVNRKIREFKLPWPEFSFNAKELLNELVVTIKSKNRIVSKPYNKYTKWFQKEDGSFEKRYFYQKPNKRWMAVRKSMFKEPQGIIWLKEKEMVSVYEAFKIQIERMKVEGDPKQRRIASYVYDKYARQILKNIILKTGIDVNETDELLEAVKAYLNKNKKRIEIEELQQNTKPKYKTVYSLENYEVEEIQVAKFHEYAAKRVTLDASFTHDKISKIPYGYARENKINIPKILHQHLLDYESDKNKKDSEAFLGEGLEELAKKAGKRIDKVTIFEKKSPDDKFGNKFVEVDKGAIAYFIIYENEVTKERSDMYSLATHKAIERLVQKKPLADKREGFKTIILSPNDLVYVPTKEEFKKILENQSNPIDWNNKKEIARRIYKMVSSSKKICQFVQHQIAKAIIPSDAKEKIKGEIDWHDKSPKTLDDDVNISSCCIKIIVDRLGEIKPQF